MATRDISKYKTVEDLDIELIAVAKEKAKSASIVARLEPKVSGGTATPGEQREYDAHKQISDDADVFEQQAAIAKPRIKTAQDKAAAEAQKKVTDAQREKDKTAADVKKTKDTETAQGNVDKGFEKAAKAGAKRQPFTAEQQAVLDRINGKVPVQGFWGSLREVFNPAGYHTFMGDNENLVASGQARDILAGKSFLEGSVPDPTDPLSQGRFAGFSPVEVSQAFGTGDVPRLRTIFDTVDTRENINAGLGLTDGIPTTLVSQPQNPASPPRPDISNYNLNDPASLAAFTQDSSDWDLQYGQTNHFSGAPKHVPSAPMPDTDTATGVRAGSQQYEQLVGPFDTPADMDAMARRQLTPRGFNKALPFLKGTSMVAQYGAGGYFGGKGLGWWGNSEPVGPEPSTFDYERDAPFFKGDVYKRLEAQPEFKEARAKYDAAIKKRGEALDKGLTTSFGGRNLSALSDESVRSNVRSFHKANPKLMYMAEDKGIQAAVSGAAKAYQTGNKEAVDEAIQNLNMLIARGQYDVKEAVPVGGFNPESPIYRIGGVSIVPDPENKGKFTIALAQRDQKTGRLGQFEYLSGNPEAPKGWADFEKDHPNFTDKDFEKYFGPEVAGRAIDEAERARDARDAGMAPGARKKQYSRRATATPETR